MSLMMFLALPRQLSCQSGSRTSFTSFFFQGGLADRSLSDTVKPRAVVMSEPKAPTPTPGDTYKGWLFKWTNYIKGYQRRWFVLSNGLLSYYRTQAEMGHTCRGTINLATANIAVEDSCNFVISNGGAQT
ncbi:hypothetical protein AOLI_G00193640 [Acnodon oligacanthus]